MKNTSKKILGFTLIELIIAMGIFALLLGLSLANFRRGQKMDDLKQATEEMVSNIRQVQNLGMSGKIIKVCEGGDNAGDLCDDNSQCNNGECKPTVPEGGYGIYLTSEIGSSTNYKLYADMGPNPDMVYDPEEDVILPGPAIFNLPPRVQIYKLSKECVFHCWSLDELDIVFQPPKPTPWANREQEQEVNIFLKHDEFDFCQRIVVNGVSGQVSEEKVDCPLE